MYVCVCVYIIKFCVYIQYVCIYMCLCVYIHTHIYIYIYMAMDHKTSLKSLEYIYSNSQKYIVWVKIIDFSFMPKIIRTLSKDHVA